MKNKLLVELHGIFKRAAKLSGVAHNSAAEVELLRVAARYDIEVFSPEGVRALVRAADDAQDAAIYLTAAFTGLRRGELIALRWRDIDFLASLVRVRASYAEGQLTTPKNGKVRAVPLAPQVASALARLGERERSTGEDDLVFLRRGRRLPGRLRASAPPLRRRSIVRRRGNRRAPHRRASPPSTGHVACTVYVLGPSSQAASHYGTEGQRVRTFDASRPTKEVRRVTSGSPTVGRPFKESCAPRTLFRRVPRRVPHSRGGTRRNQATLPMSSRIPGF
jgi:integrase